jgi:hypothetical protein
MIASITERDRLLQIKSTLELMRYMTVHHNCRLYEPGYGKNVVAMFQDGTLILNAKAKELLKCVS